MRSNSGAIQPAMPCGSAACARPWPLPAGTAFIHRRASHGVTTKAIASDSSMPMLALMGMGLMYGPIRPDTKAIGSSAAITVSVARMVGPPTSSTAAGNDLRQRLAGIQLLVAVDVLDHHDGVVDQDADGENQRKQRHPVERETPRPGRKQRCRQREHHGNADDGRLAPPQRDEHQRHHRRGGKQQLSESAFAPCRWRWRRSCAW